MNTELIAQLDADIKARQELKEIALAVEAGAEWEVQTSDKTGKPGHWLKPLMGFSFEWYVKDGWQVRLKPKPVTRRWNKPEDVPLNCWLKTKRGNASLVLHVAKEGVGCAGHPECVKLTWDELDNYEYSTDRINWKPCETTEEAK